MAEKKPQESLEKKVKELEAKVTKLFTFLKTQSEIKKVGGEVFGNYPEE